MNNLQNKFENSISSYVDSNREKIDVALLSLRIIKQIDTFLDINNISQKELADKLGVSEAFISQLMSGSKKINVQLLNKFEKRFNVEFDFKLKDKSTYISFYEVANKPLELKSPNMSFKSIQTFSINNFSDSVFEFASEANTLTLKK